MAPRTLGVYVLLHSGADFKRRYINIVLSIRPIVSVPRTWNFVTDISYRKLSVLLSIVIYLLYTSNGIVA